MGNSQAHYTVSPFGLDPTCCNPPSATTDQPEMKPDRWTEITPPAPLSYPPWWTEEEPRPADVRLPLTKLAEPVSSAAPQPDLFAETERARSAAAGRWERLFASEVYAAQRALAAKGAPDDDAIRAALDALYEAKGRLPVPSLAKRPGAAPSHARRAIDGLQRLPNVNGYPVLRLSADAEHVELDATLLIERFGLKP